MKRYNTRRLLDVTQSTSVDIGTVFAADFALHPHAQMNSSQSKLNEDNARTLSKGDRVHLSELGCSRHPRDAEKKGTVVGNSQYPNSLRILWDGSRWPVAVHRDYLQLLREEVSKADGRPRLPQRKRKRLWD